MIRFRVPLRPKPLKRHRLGKRNRVYDPNVAEKERWIRSALQQVSAIAASSPTASPRIQAQEVRPIQGPVKVHLCFNLKRPQSHYRTGRFKADLRADAPTLPTSKYYGDIDNLAKVRFRAGYIRNACVLFNIPVMLVSYLKLITNPPINNLDGL